ncbi:TlpA family protein disulfide reductase [Rhizosphaericola mali]|uniref:TlpA family protein disulfide reductase n=1 Tax=Rhizosphaericola mali TaxID=2545455 RepID=A0A5P2GAE5_9BACT|nr:TlpA disulfide reductase family protein [Rhizosphaericola mali]QES88521.1 TlpA family protein disulfide reductase [Rhizosphaericola mali]
MNIRAILLIIFIFLFSNNHAQQIKPLQIGDTIPDLTLQNILNYKGNTVRISDFRSKLLVLDFWATWCTACINTFAHNNEIQKKYNVQVKILNVTYEPTDFTANFLDKLVARKGNAYSITTVTNDTTLQQIFPHKFVPHLVWIDSNRVVRAITASRQLTPENIDKILGQHTVDFQQKADIKYTQPLFLSSAILDSSFTLQHYSLLVHGNIYDGAGVGQYYLKDHEKTYGLNYTNQSLLFILNMLGNQIWENYYHSNFNQNRILLELSDSTTMDKLRKDNWQFSFVVSKNNSDSFFIKALDEIGKNTDIDVQIEQRLMNCIALVRTTNNNKIVTKGGRPLIDLWSKKKGNFRNQPIKYFVNELDGGNITPLPIIDATGIRGNIDITLYPPYTLENIRCQIKSYGLNLVPVKKTLNVIIVHDKSKKQ